MRSFGKRSKRWTGKAPGVLDLRANGGGLLEEAVLTASRLRPEGEVVVTPDSRTQGHAEYRTVGDNLPKRPVVVLIDRNTASAAEILAAALADDANAPVVGTRSVLGASREGDRSRKAPETVNLRPVAGALCAF